MGTQVKVKNSTGDVLRTSKEASYLGVRITDTSDTKSALVNRVKDTMMVWKRLAIYWKNNNTSKEKKKMQVYDAVIQSKLMYGLESLHITPSSLQNLMSFISKD